MRHRKYQIPQQLLWSAVGWLLYVGLFLVAYTMVGEAAATLVIIPVALTAWQFGIRGGLLGALLNIPVTALLFVQVGRVGMQVMIQRWPGIIAGLIVGVVIGGLRDLLKKIRAQSQLLAAEQATLRLQIAERERAEAELRQARDELLAANQRLQELDRLKDQFVSNVSHELRTPLTNILLHINLLKRGKIDRRDLYLNTLQREAERLRALIENLLDLSRLDRDANALQLILTDLNPMLRQLVADRIDQAAEHGLMLEFVPVADLPLTLIDTALLTQVASNLMTNAINYTPPGGCVTLRTAVQNADGQPWVTFTINDTGPGISAADMPHLFSRFYRGEVGRTTNAPGTGLGLAISKAIIERLYGRITVDSVPGHGAAFTVWLPVATI